MRNIIEILRLDEAGLKRTQIKRVTKVARKTIREYVTRAKAVGLNYALVKDMNEKEVYEKLFPEQEPDHKKPLPGWKEIHEEMIRPGVTITLLWEEYIQQNPDGYKYSQFCDLYKLWRKHLNISMRQVHKAGEKTFVDYSGMTIPIINRTTGEVKNAEIFVAVLGASNYTFACATKSQQLQDWIESHEKAFEYFGGVTEIVVPDNLRSGVTKACRYEPEINRIYQDMAIHYGIAVVPTRPAKPKDKPKVEAGVLLVQRWILARLRNHTFFSLEEVNKKIRELLVILNNKKFKKLEGTRMSMFEKLDKPVLKPLPLTKYEFSTWEKAKVNIDCHIQAEGHFYSVPCRFVSEKIDVRVSSSTVSFFKDNQQIAVHKRSFEKNKCTTIMEHLPKSHQEYGQWTPERIISWTKSIGEYTALVAQKIIESKHHPVQGYKSVLGLIGLEKKFGKSRVEFSAKRALAYGSFSYWSIKSILQKGLDKLPLENEQNQKTMMTHENIRGPEFYCEQPQIKEEILC